MPHFRYSLAALGLSTLFLVMVVAHAILAPLPEKSPASGPSSSWSTVVVKN